MAEFSAKDKQGFALAAIVGVAFLALFAAYFALSNKEAVDDRFCPEVIERKTVFLIDRSDDTPTQTVAEIKNRIAQTISHDVVEGELVSIFYITDSAQRDLRPVFSMCKPRSTGNELYEDERTIKRKFEASFRKPLDAALQEQPSDGRTSPVAETLTDFLSSDFLDGKFNRLSLVSDLMQNSDAVGLYGCSNRRDAIATYRQARAGAVERPELKNVEVQLNIIPRQGLGADVVSCRDGFWAWFFGNNEGERAGLTSRYLPGGASVDSIATAARQLAQPVRLLARLAERSIGGIATQPYVLPPAAELHPKNPRGGPAVLHAQIEPSPVAIDARLFECRAHLHVS